MLFTTRRAASRALDKELSRLVAPKKKNIFEKIDRGLSTALNIISNTVKTIENCTEMMNKATTQMNEAMYNKLSPEAKAKYDAHMAELYSYTSKDKHK